MNTDTFAMIPNWLMRRRDVPATAKLLYARLAQYRGNNHVAWPGINTLAVEIGVHRVRVIQHQHTLERLALLRVERKAGISNRYTLLAQPGTSSGNATSNGNATSSESVTPPVTETLREPVAETLPKEISKKSGKRPNTLVVEFPDSLNVPAVRTAWAEYVEHRKQLRKPLTPLAAQKQLANLASMGPDRAVAAINHSIAKGWQGIFEECQQTKTTGTHTNRAVTGRPEKYANVGSTL